MNTERVDQLCDEGRTIQEWAAATRREMIDMEMAMTLSHAEYAKETVKAEFLHERIDSSFTRASSILEEMFPLAVVFLEKSRRESWINNLVSVARGAAEYQSGNRYETPSEERQQAAQAQLDTYHMVRSAIIEDNDSVVEATVSELRHAQQLAKDILVSMETDIERYRYYMGRIESCTTDQ